MTIARTMITRTMIAPTTMLSRLLLAAALLCAAPAFAQAPKDAKPSPALQKEYDAFIAKFRAALKANDVAAVIGMTKLPFMAESDAATFRAKVYPQFFTPKNRTCIQRGKGVYDRDGENNDNYFIFCGQHIFVFSKTPAGFLFTDIGAND